MTKVASSELQKLDDEVQECQVIYLPQVIAESEMSEWLSHLATWREHLEVISLFFERCLFYFFSLGTYSDFIEHLG